MESGRKSDPFRTIFDSVTLQCTEFPQNVITIAPLQKKGRRKTDRWTNEQETLKSIQRVIMKRSNV